MNDTRPVGTERDEEGVRVAGGAFRGWPASLYGLGALLLVLIALYWSTAVSIVDIWWRSETYAHGFLIIPISVYLMWRQRRALQEVDAFPSPWGLGLLGFLALVWLLGNAANVILVQQLAFALMIPASVLTLFGIQVLRVMAFPLGYLVFAVPFGEFLIPPLMDWTAWFSVKALQITGVPVYWEGRYITLPTGNWEVAEACSGVRYLIASLAVGCLYAYLTYRSMWRRVLFIGMAGIAPILANGIRAYGIIMLGHLSDMRIAVGVDHVIYGWLFFGVVMLILFGIGSLWREAESPKSAGAYGATATDQRTAAAGGAGEPSHSVLCAVTVGAAAVMGAGPAGAAWLSRDVVPDSQFVLQLPEGAQGWSGPVAAESRWEPRFPAGDQRIHKLYARGQAEVEVYVIVYRVQHQGAELINSRNRVYDGKYWTRLGETRRAVQLRSGTVLEVRETMMRSAQSNRLVWSWYDIDGHQTANPWLGKFWDAWTRLLGRAGDPTLVMLAADYDLYPADARRVLEMFVNDVPAFTRARGLSQSAAGETVTSAGAR